MNKLYASAGTPNKTKSTKSATLTPTSGAVPATGGDTEAVPAVVTTEAADKSVTEAVTGGTEVVSCVAADDSRIEAEDSGCVGGFSVVSVDENKLCATTTSATSDSPVDAGPARRYECFALHILKFKVLSMYVLVVFVCTFFTNFYELLFKYD